MRENTKLEALQALQRAEKETYEGRGIGAWASWAVNKEYDAGKKAYDARAAEIEKLAGEVEVLRKKLES